MQIQKTTPHGSSKLTKASLSLSYYSIKVKVVEVGRRGGLLVLRAIVAVD
jgi:hypothetical protein